MTDFSHFAPEIPYSYADEAADLRALLKDKDAEIARLREQLSPRVVVQVDGGGEIEVDHVPDTGKKEE